MTASHKAVRDRPPRVLLVERAETRAELEHALREVCARSGAELDTTESAARGLELLRTRGDWALILADQLLRDQPGERFLRDAMVLHPDAVRFLLAYAEPEPRAPARDPAYRIFQRPIQVAAIAGFASEALRLHALDRQRVALVKEVGLRAERLERRRKLLDVVVRERTRELENTLARLRVAGRQAIAGLGQAIEAHDGYEGHGARVAAAAARLGAVLGLAPPELEILEMAAVLHDIGKVGVRDRVLLKDGPLDETEWEVVRLHPTLGADIVGKIEMLREVAEAIRHCREHWDGSGYPDGLTGDSIPLAARIMAVADAFDACRSRRPYREAMDEDSAYRAVTERGGTWFDPALVEQFVARRLG
jgi:response regulator RpfG family c-di-GMP phosphodiesterase